MLREKGVAVEAVVDVSEARREAAKRAFPQARVYETHRALLSAEKGLDFAVVTTPPLYHAPAVLDALAAGLHVLCEKPLTLDPASLVAVRHAARERAVYCVNNWAYSPQWAKLIELSKTLGPLRRAEIHVLRTQPSVSALPGDWRKDPAVAGGGILVDHGWHNLYLLRRLLGDLELSETMLHPAGAVDEQADVTLNGPRCSARLFMTWRAARRANTARVEGERGSLELDDDRLIVRRDGREEIVQFAEKLSAGSAHPEWLSAMWPAFEAECAGRGRGESLAEAAFCLRAIRAAYGAGETALA